MKQHYFDSQPITNMKIAKECIPYFNRRLQAICDRNGNKQKVRTTKPFTIVLN